MRVDPTVIGAVVVCIIVILLLGKAFLGISKSEGEKMSKKDMLQRKVDYLARGSDADRWQAVGKSGRDAAKSGGCLGKLVFWGSLSLSCSACSTLLLVMVRLSNRFLRI